MRQQRWKIISFFAIFVSTLLISISLHFPVTAQDGQNVDDIAKHSVELGSVPLFEIESDVGSFSQQERAEAISKRLLMLAKEAKLSEEQIKTEAQSNGVKLLAGDQVIMLVTNQDAEAAGLSAQQLANSHIQKIKAGLKRYNIDYNKENLLYQVLIAGGITLVFLLLMGILNIVAPKLHQKIHTLKGNRINTLKFQNLEILSADQIAQALILVVNIVKTLIRLGLIYIFLLSVLSLFPETQFLAQRLVVYVVVAFQTIWTSFINYLPNLVFISVIVLLCHYIVRGVRYFCRAVETGLVGFPGFDQEWAKPTYQIVRFLIVAAAVTLAIPYLPGSSSPAVQGMSIFFGILVSLGSTAVAANVVAGLALTYTRAFKIGDRVKIAETTGDVIEKTLLVTQLRTPKNMVVTIPNGMVLSDQIINYSAIDKDHSLILYTQVTLGYDVPWEKVERVLIEAALATPRILRDPNPFVLQKGLEDFYVTYELNAHTCKPTDMNKTYSILHQNIQNFCNENDIEILSPHYSAVRDGNETTIPESYRADNYQAPHFRLAGFSVSPPKQHQPKNHHPKSHQQNNHTS